WRSMRVLLGLAHGGCSVGSYVLSRVELSSAWDATKGWTWIFPYSSGSRITLIKLPMLHPSDKDRTSSSFTGHLARPKSVRFRDTPPLSFIASEDVFAASSGGDLG
ncbi:hypothetical protein J6590_040096, partial [Homalodisca vitripennis]